MQISVSKQIHADLAHQHGFLGEGIGIAYLDTGLFPHKDFSPHSTRIAKLDRKSTRLNSSHIEESRMPSSA